VLGVEGEAYTSGLGVGFAASGRLLGSVDCFGGGELTLRHSVLDVVHDVSVVVELILWNDVPAKFRMRVSFGEISFTSNRAVLNRRSVWSFSYDD
jgi:hypothetical protein